jgi:hypothetical protein
MLVLPPLAQFFVGFFLTLVIAGGSVLLMHWLGQGEEE